MVRGEAIMELFKLGLASIATGAAGSPLFRIFTQYVPVTVWNVPVTVIMAALAGSLLSLFFGDPIESRKSLIGQVLASAMFGAAAARLSADIMAWEWAHKNMAMFALMTAAMIRWFLPTIIDRGKSLIKEFRFPSRKGSPVEPPSGDK